MAAYLSRTFGTATNQNRWTLSMWIKRGRQQTGTEGFVEARLFETDAGSPEGYFAIASDTTINFYNAHDGSNLSQLYTTRKFRDSTGWMHICLREDTPNATADDRQQLWINGVRETSFTSENEITQNGTSRINAAVSHSIGVKNNGGPHKYFLGCMSHIVFVDGLSLAPTYFGEVDSASGIWKFKNPVVSEYGNNGFYILKNDNSGTDQSGKGNNWTTTGTITPTKDNPSNNFCTLNPNLPYGAAGGLLINGNTTMTQSSTSLHQEGILGMEGGKYYWEIEISQNNGDFGVCENGRARQLAPTNNYPFYFVTNPGTTTTTIYNNPRSGSNSSTFTGTSHEIGDVVMMAYDADNGNLYYGKNGSWENSGDPTSGATGTGAVVTGIETQYGGVIVPFIGSKTASERTFECNFGNGYFGTTSHGETNSDSASIGLFKYSVPTGYYALCTKNIKTQGGI